MTKNSKQILSILILLSCVYFLVFLFPNMEGAKDVNMLSVFEPDEFAQYPHVIRMLRGGEIFEAIRRFFAYQHYFYGFPFYFSSAITVFPIKLIQGHLGNTRLTMTTLRQMVNVLPMILTILLLVYLQTGFENYAASIGLYIFLAAIPIVVKNNLWWHPESLVLLFLVLTLFFLDRDKFNFDRSFYLAAITTGIATATKLIGLFYFLTIPVYILLGIINKHIDRKQALAAATKFVLIMFVAILLSSPMLLIPGELNKVIKIQKNQAEAMSFGWGVAYAKGPASWFGIIQEYYGLWVTILIAFFLVLVGIFANRKRVLNITILTWVLPYSFYILFFIAIKPKHFFMPVALPLFSSLAMISLFFEEKSGEISKSTTHSFMKARKILGCLLLLVVAWQGVQYVSWDIDYYLDELNREKESDSINFFKQVEDDYLAQIPDDYPLSIYRDVRIYVPERNVGM